MIFCYVGNSTKFRTPISLRIKGFDKLTDTDIILILFKEKRRKRVLCKCVQRCNGPEFHIGRINVLPLHLIPTIHDIFYNLIENKDICRILCLGAHFVDEESLRSGEAAPVMSSPDSWVKSP